MIVLQGRLYSSKNSKQIKSIYKKKTDYTPEEVKERLLTGKAPRRTILAKSDRAYQQQDELVIQLKDAHNRRKWREMIADKPFPLLLHLTYFPPDATKFDVQNIFQGLLDAMRTDVKTGKTAAYLPDDNYEYVIPVYNPVVEIDRKNPRVEIRVLSGIEYKF